MQFSQYNPHLLTLVWNCLKAYGKISLLLGLLHAGQNAPVSQGASLTSASSNIKSRNVWLKIFSVSSIQQSCFLPSDSQHTPSETSGDPEVEVTIEG